MVMGRPAGARLAAWSRARAGAATRLAVAAVAGAVAGCDVNTALEQIAQARHLASDLLVHFTRAADSANRAVMASTDEASVALAREAEESKRAAQADVEALGPMLQALGFEDEARLLKEFVARFAEYRELDRQVLELTVENTNLKAQRLSFGPALESADAFVAALGRVAPANPARDAWRVKALVASAAVNVREIQVLQAPHIADADDAVMTRMEKRMDGSAAVARQELSALAPLLSPASRAHLDAANAALDRFMKVNAELLHLSRRNTNVRALALSLNQKAKVAAGCTDSLRALRDALAKRGFSGTR
jgi:hypothetical protein